MECLLEEAASKFNSDLAAYMEFASAGISMVDIENLLAYAVRLRSGTDLHQRLMRVLPFLTYGAGDKMSLVIRHFNDVLDFGVVDEQLSAERTDKEPKMTDMEAKMLAFVALCKGIERKQIGNTMKAQIIELGIVDKCIKYLKVSPTSFKSMLNERLLHLCHLVVPTGTIALESIRGDEKR